VGKIAEKAVCRSVLMNKNALLQTVFFLAILPTGLIMINLNQV